MALYIMYKDEERQYHLDDLSRIVNKLPVRTHISGTVAGVTEVQADGDELEYIKLHFTNIPMADKRVVCWYGDHAKFIVGNL